MSVSLEDFLTVAEFARNRVSKRQTRSHWRAPDAHPNSGEFGYEFKPQLVSRPSAAMQTKDFYPGRNDHLSRLSAEHYRGPAYVHWSMTIKDRKTGWLIPTFYYKFREILTHTMFRYGLCCPIYCCMPDHLHLLWVGMLPGSDQCLAARFFRRQLNPILEKLGARFQREPYDHVLSEEARDRSLVEEVFQSVGE